MVSSRPLTAYPPDDVFRLALHKLSFRHILRWTCLVDLMPTTQRGKTYSTYHMHVPRPDRDAPLQARGCKLINENLDHAFCYNEQSHDNVTMQR